LELCRESVGPSSEVGCVVDSEDALIGGVHVVSDVTIAEGDSFLYGSGLVDDHDDGVEKVTFVEVPDLLGLYLKEHGQPLRFFFPRDTHAAVLVGSG
jgi:hypothetical protein